MGAIRGIFFVLVFALPCRGQDADWPDLSVPSKSVGGGEYDAAVIVGAENYSVVGNIPGARDNAEAWHAYLTETLRVPVERVTLLRDNEATIEKIRKYAKKAASDVAPGGTLWFVFIGHGAPSRDGKQGVLVGWDAQQDVDSLYARSLPTNEVIEIISKGRQGRTVVLVDACFSGKTPEGRPLVRGMQPLILTNMYIPMENRLILMTAAKGDQFAGPLPNASVARPAFSYLALGALRGWAADVKGQITASGVVDFARKALTLARDRTQTPELISGPAGVVLGKGLERMPDLARIGRSNVGASPKFKISTLPDIPLAETPRALGQTASGLDFGKVDVSSLERYDAVVNFDKGSSLPAEKAAKWREFSKQDPQFAAIASERASEWDRYSIQREVAEKARAQLMAVRDADWEKLRRLLALGIIPDDDKKRWANQFIDAYQESAGIEPNMASALKPYLLEGAVRDKLLAMERRERIFPQALSARAEQELLVSFKSEEFCALVEQQLRAHGIPDDVINIVRARANARRLVPRLGGQGTYYLAQDIWNDTIFVPMDAVETRYGVAQKMAKILQNKRRR
jgi:hypothetical protein